MNRSYDEGKGMDLQIFAEPGGGVQDPQAGAQDLQAGTQDPQAGTQDPQAGGSAQQAKGSSFDDFLKSPEHQAEFDKRIAKALAKQAASLSASSKAAIEEAKKEAQKLAKMNAEEKQAYEMERLKAENEKLKEQSRRAELAKGAAALLKEEKVDATGEMLDLLVGADEEETKNKVQQFLLILKSQVKAAEVARATGNTAKNFGGGASMSEIQKRIAKYRK